MKTPKKDQDIGLTGRFTIPRYGIMMDLETLGVGSAPVITQIAAKAFDIETGEQIGACEFNKFINVRDSLKNGLELCADTMKFWLNDVPTEVYDKVLVPAMDPKTRNLEVALRLYSEWVLDVRKELQATLEAATPGSCPKLPSLYLWGNGTFSDNKWLESAYTAVRKNSDYKMEFPFNFREHFDMRTFTKMACAITGRNLYKEFNAKNPVDTSRQHEASYDVDRQIAQVNYAYIKMSWAVYGRGSNE